MDIDSFLHAYRKRSKINHHIQEEHRNRIPKTGPLIIVANHPTGIPDGLVILDTLMSVRRDVKIIANELMHQFEPLSPYTIPVDPYGHIGSVVKNASPLKSVLNWLSEGHCIVLFPSGDVSNLDTKLNEISEQSWHSTAKKILMRFDGTILPWAITGRNSTAFYHASRISPIVKSALLPREGLKRKKRPLHSLLGKPVEGKRNEYFLFDLETTCRLLGQEAGNAPKFPFQDKFWRKYNFAKRAVMEPLAEPVLTIHLEEEIYSLGPPVAQKGPLQVFSFEGVAAKNLLLEIGRLREKTFREVNEGTGKQTDLDTYDEFCTHLVLWDKYAKRIAGGYRMYVGSKWKEDAYRNSSLQPHYKEKEDFTALFEKSVVLGRAFVEKEYQLKPFPLFLLWNAIERLVKQETTITFIIGQTSLPSTYSDHSKALLVQFLNKHYCHDELSKLFVPTHPYLPIENSAVFSWIANSAKKDFKRLDNIVSNLEPNGERIPLLFKRYLDQGAQLLCANVDPSFNHSLDILLITRVEDLCHGNKMTN